MKVILTASFERDFKKRSDKEKDQAYEVISELPKLLGKPHLHSGVGIRKIHPSGIFEARLGLGLRLAFALEKNTLILHRLGDHDTIRDYFKNL